MSGLRFIAIICAGLFLSASIGVSQAASEPGPSSGPLTSWDHRPDNDVANAYVRNHQDWAEAGPRLRYPPFTMPEPTS